MSTIALARSLGAHPADLAELDGRFSAPVFPGELLEVSGWVEERGADFTVAGGGRPVITGGRARFGG